MKVIFLDIDGVMNNTNHAVEMYNKYQNKEITYTEYNNAVIHDYPYNEPLKLLKEIVDKTEAKIVLSSSWRNLRGRIEKLNEIFAPYGYSIIDSTPDRVTLEQLQLCGFAIENSFAYKIAMKYEGTAQYLKKIGDRGAEIAWWLYNHPEVESFVILDDDYEDISQYFENNWCAQKLALV